MQKILLLLGLSISTTYSHSQPTNLQQLWVGENSNYLLISDSLVRIEHPTMDLVIDSLPPPGHPLKNFKTRKSISSGYYRYTITKDTLRIKEELRAEVKPHDFIIQKLSPTELTIKAIDTLSSFIIDNIQPNNHSFKFRNRGSIITDSIHFEKLLFHATKCYGPCPEMTFTLDSSKHFQFIGGRAAVKQGSYTAQLSTDLYQELLNILRMSALDNLLYTELQISEDLPIYEVEIHYNGKMQYVTTMLFPVIGQSLLAYLMKLPGKLALYPAAQPFDIRFSAPNAIRHNWPIQVKENSY